jgi:SAM-dependent methyltransferase
MYSPKDYWKHLAELYDSADTSGFAPVLHPNAPAWFNALIDELQSLAVLRAITIAAVPIGARFLDVGCGTGRWIRRYQELEFLPFGVDATFGMLRIARTHQTRVPLAMGLAHDLPFADGVFDCLSDITVIQHIPYELQRKALLEMVRVLRPGGRIILLELVRGEGSHVFPRPENEWIREVESCGAKLLKSFGVEYLFFDRLFVRFAQRMSMRSGDLVDKVQSTSPNISSSDYTLARRLFWTLRRVTVGLSAWAEPTLSKICPASMATHAIFIFTKASE